LSRKLWQKLGDMSAEEAQREYIRIVEDVLPQWQSPPSWDGALLVSQHRGRVLRSKD
jgi:hypothetical protein